MELIILEDKFSRSYEENVYRFESAFTKSMDFLCKKFLIGDVKAALLSMDGLTNKQTIAQSILNPVIHLGTGIKDRKSAYDFVKEHTLSAAEQIEGNLFSEAVDKLLSGFAILIIDGSENVLMFGVQGFAARDVSEPENEASGRGSKEGFVETYQSNIALIRRRLRTTDFKSERMVIGKESNTSVAICYLESVVSQKLLDGVKKKLSKVNLRSCLAAGYISPFLSGSGVFATTGYTERPDTVCGKISEGRIAVIIDGTPNVLIIPYLFNEYFQSFDDYAARPFFAAFTRGIKLISFLTAILLPGMYVAVLMYHPQTINTGMLIKISEEISKTPLSVFSETILTVVLYEIMREAGIRVQKVLSLAAGIVGGLVVGEAAVNAGIITSMTLMVVAVSALSSYTVPKLYEPIAAVRIIIIIAGGLGGIWGVFIICAFLIADTCAQSSFGIPFTAPLSPFSVSSMRDTLWRASWKKLSEKPGKIQDMPGAGEGKE